MASDGTVVEHLPDGLVSGRLRNGQRLPVLRCEDTKSTIEPVVAYDRRGLLIRDGEYTINRFPVWQRLDLPFVWSCPRPSASASIP